MTAKFNKWWFAATKLFHEMQTETGLEDARRIFKEIAGPATPKQRKGWKNMELVARYDCMAQPPNVLRLARELAKENRHLPRELRHGPTGSTDPKVLYKQIRRLVARRRAKRGLLRVGHFDF
jgi:hypothetical protein